MVLNGVHLIHVLAFSAESVGSFSGIILSIFYWLLMQFCGIFIVLLLPLTLLLWLFLVRVNALIWLQMSDWWPDMFV